MKISKRLKKKIFNPYNFGIFVAILLIAVAVYIFVKPENKQEKKVTPSGIEVVTSKISESEEISEQDAKKMAVKQLKKIGETVKTDELNCIKILKNKEEYYYISSPKNTVEIKIKGGIVTMINSATVEE